MWRNNMETTVAHHYLMRAPRVITMHFNEVALSDFLLIEYYVLRKSQEKFTRQIIILSVLCIVYIYKLPKWYCVISNYSWIEILRNVVIKMYLKSMKALLIRIFSSYSKKIIKLLIITCGHFCVIACHYSPTESCVECIYRAYIYYW